ncbi:MAG: hypothetical protein KDA77_07995, partial [Planctomycetaceae bacterium]|nr:hypothetical protein [Planctomycetaceae bacterium]
MLNSNLIVDIILRLSIVLLLGWLGLRLTAKQNPRWSVLMTRFLIVACLGLPVVYLCLPTTTLAVLPAQAKGVQATKASSIEGNAVLQQSSWIQALDHTSDVVSKPVIVGTESSLREPAEREAVTTVLVPQSNVNDLRVSASDPFTLRNETSRSETLVNDSTGATVHLDATTSHASGSLAQWLGICWLAGCVLFLLKIGIQFRRAKLLLRTSTLAPESIQRECNALATKLALRSIPQVCVSTAIKGPCTAGLLQPMIFLPQSWSESLSEQERRAVLMHELSHIADRDSLWDLLSRIVTALWWFHPLVWRLAAQHRLACEHMSDARAAASTAGFDAYRQMLAQWALRRQGAESNTAVLAMADRSFMLRRLKWLEVPRSFETLGRLRRTLFLLIAVLMFLGVASVKFIPQASAQQPEVRDQVQTTEKAKPLPAEKNATEKKNAKQDEKQKPAVLPQRPNVADIDTSQTTPRIVRVVDQNDQPIAGAKVSVGWWEDNEGDIEGVLSLNPPVTNEKGEVTIQVPRGAARAQLSAQAPGFASAGKQYALSGEPTLILKPGRIIRVKAVDTKGRLLNDAYPLLEESNHFGREFKRDKGLVGYFTSPVVGLERRWMRVVDGSGEGPILFSDLIDVTNPEQVTQDGAILATLYAGIRLEGRLDDSVPRPIKNGCVELYINEGEKHRIGGGWVWQDTALVQEDGTFVFDSLPAGGHVQLFALVDGYQSTRPSAEALTAYLQDEDAGAATLLTNVLERQDAFWPQLFPLPRGLYKTEVELPCTLSTSLDLKLLDPAGRPISEASVNFNPNGLFISGELFIPTTEVLTQASLVRHKDPVQAKRLHEWANATFLNVESDEKGIAHVRNLPTHGRQTFQVTAPGFMLPAYPSISMPAPNRYALIDLKAGKTLQRTITMEKLLPISSRQVMVMN